MSANRSVQAAQRRRAGPQETSVPGRGPQPSINSSQMFANQSKPGQGQNMSSGRLAGQQAAMQQKQMQQQSQQKPEGISGVSKMTIAQAITLITLRLGAVETKLISLDNEAPVQGITIDGQENIALIDKTVIQSITSRLESLEKRSNVGSSAGPEVTLLKQQLEMVKQSVVQTKGTTATIIKDLKSQVDSLKNELTETKELLSALQIFTIENSNKIIELSSGDFDQILEHDVDYNTLVEQSGISVIEDVQELHDNISQHGKSQGNTLDDEIIGTKLKELIENKLNADM